MRQNFADACHFGTVFTGKFKKCLRRTEKPQGGEILSADRSSGAGKDTFRQGPAGMLSYS